jgi:sulfate adenylyltransferase subunit 2
MTTLTHLQRLEAESIDIMREAVSDCEKPVMLYSIGKDSSVMLHLAIKAFFPSKPPFPLLHVDTTWKFREMYEFRDARVRQLGLELIVHVNPEAVKRGINPFTHGSAVRNHDAGRDRRAPACIGQAARRRSDQFPDQRRKGNV